MFARLCFCVETSNTNFHRSCSLLNKHTTRLRLVYKIIKYPATFVERRDFHVDIRNSSDCLGVQVPEARQLTADLRSEIFLSLPVGRVTYVVAYFQRSLTLAFLGPRCVCRVHMRTIWRVKAPTGRDGPLNAVHVLKMEAIRTPETLILT